MCQLDEKFAASPIDKQVIGETLDWLIGVRDGKVLPGWDEIICMAGVIARQILGYESEIESLLLIVDELSAGGNDV